MSTHKPLPQLWEHDGEIVDLLEMRNLFAAIISCGIKDYCYYLLKTIHKHDTVTTSQPFWKDIKKAKAWLDSPEEFGCMWYARVIELDEQSLRFLIDQI